MAIDSKDYLEISKGRYTQQFKSKPNFNALVKTWLGATDDIQKNLSDIDDIKYIDRASGKNLDNIGDIVGQDRILVDVLLLPFFGYLGNPQSRSYGDLGDASIGGRWRSVGERLAGNVTLEDDEYRLFIRSKIVRNTTLATPEDTILSTEYILQSDGIELVEGPGPAMFSINIGKILTEFEKALLKYSYTDQVERTLIIKPAGVRIDHIMSYDPDSYFGFQGVPGVRGYGDILEVARYGTGEDGAEFDYIDPDSTTLQVGGKFAEII